MVRNRRSKLKLVVVLVCLNNFDSFLKTIMSLKKLSYNNMVVLVVDSSTNKKILEFTEIDTSFFYIYKWEKQNGVYSAMNTAIDCASPGSYLWFLNPGDTLVSDNVVLEIMEGLEKSNTNWSVAQARNAPPNVSQVYPFEIHELTKRNVATGKIKISHQAIIVLRETLIRYGYFNTNYRIAADQEMLMVLIENKPLFIPKVLVEIDQNGLSSKRPFRTIYETIRVNHNAEVWNLLESIFIFFIKILILLFGTTALYLSKTKKRIWR